jgi:tRNA 5-methylaminomethyl-2-thiouridine biosynthesis bifunctional protein
VWHPLEPARVVLDPGGAPFSEAYRDVYASRDGALAQAHQVFLAGNDLPERWRARDQFVIVETGFGLAVNFLATWHAWRADPRRPRRLHFVSIEKHPVERATLLRLAPEPLEALAAELTSDWPSPVAGLHRRAFDGGRVVLTLGFGAAADLLPRVVAGADAFFLDGFAPDRNPELWTPAVMKALARLARNDATLATWSTARAVRDALGAAGFAIDIRAGFGRKREMLCARFAPRWRVRRYDPAVPYAGERHALVIGAGLAGAHAAWVLASRGWRVDVLERAARAALGASALPCGLLHPQITLDDNHAGRLSRTGFQLARAVLRQVVPDGLHAGTPVWRGSGTFVQIQDRDQAERFGRLAEALKLPREFARFCVPDEAATLVGLAPRLSGWWFAQGMVVAVPVWCRALLAQPSISFHPVAGVDRLEQRDGAWFARDAAGAILATAPVCIVAGALDAPRLLRLAHAAVRPVRGRLSLLQAAGLAPLRASLGGGGTLARVDECTFAAGATYEIEDDAGHRAAVSDTAAHDGNRRRLGRLLAGQVDAVPVGMFDALRCVARDRLPLAGAVADESAALTGPRREHGAHLRDLPRRPGLYASFAFGSRGLALAPLAAEWIAAQIEGEPWPLEHDLAERIDVARFLLQRMRRGNAPPR